RSRPRKVVESNVSKSRSGQGWHKTHRPLRQKPVRLGQEETKMKSQILGLRVAGTVFALVGLGHLLRIITQADVLIAGWQMPVWVNAVGALIAGGLSLWMWKLSSRAAG